MEIRIYDKNMNFLNVIENHNSLEWHRKYYEAGNFTLYIPLTPQNIRLCQRGNLVWKRGAVEAGVIEDVVLDDNPRRKMAYIKGRFLSSWMSRRVILGTMNFSGKIEVGMRRLFNNITPFTTPTIELGTLNNFQETVRFQATYKNMADYETKLAQYGGYGYRFRPDFTAKKVTFEIYKGVDRSRSQSENAYVEFSDTFDNLVEMQYTDNDQLWKNVAYVGGQGEGDERVFVEVGDTESTGLDRRELYVDARDMAPDLLTDAQYEEALKTRGREKLEQYIRSQTVNLAVNAESNFVYLRDYDLGDIVTIKKSDWGINEDLRITEIAEIYEHGKMTVEPTFGSRLPFKITWEDD